jgi:hypothetical protein
MIPENEFQDEVADYVEIFIKAAMNSHDVRAKAVECAKLITTLARSVEFGAVSGPATVK